LFVHQPNCLNKTVVRIASNPNFEFEQIDEETILFTIDTPKEPQEFNFIIDTIGVMIEKFWIEPSTKKIDFYLFNCKQYMFYVKDPSELTRQARAEMKYTEYLQEKSLNREEFIEEYNAHKINFIENNKNSFIALDAIYKIKTDKDTKKELLYSLDDSLKQYPFYKKLLNQVEVTEVSDILPFNFTLQNVNNDTIDFNLLKNKPTAFIFWMSGCKWSNKLMPDLTSLSNKYKDINFIYYCLDENLSEWKFSSEKFEIPQTYNVSELDGFLGKIPTMLRVDRTPFFVLIDDKQKIVLVTFGNEVDLLELEIQNLDKK
jgi:thiol-disulfide isomerase/thioredoxin